MTMNNIVRKVQFKRDFKRIAKQGKNLQELESALFLLFNEKPLPERFADHSLHGDYDGYRELHIKPDWLLIYKIEDETLILARTGSHAELFK
jgi:mRNA interferase YafQ